MKKEYVFWYKRVLVCSFLSVDFWLGLKKCCCWGGNRPEKNMGQKTKIKLN